jgi:cytochrome d ubiquinol oxidase subunit II
MYVVLDGFALGIGILNPWLSAKERDIAISVLLPTWDGNQTWLVFSLAAFYGMFPKGFAYIMPHIYLPALLMGLMLLFRGVCFEFRLKSKAGIKNWDRLFAFSSLVIAFLHGFIAGQVIVGFGPDNLHSGIALKIISGLVLCIGYVMLGSTRLMLKCEGDLRQKALNIAKKMHILLIPGMLIIGLVTLTVNPVPSLESLKFWLLVLLLVITLIALTLFTWTLYAKRHALPYLATVFIFLCTYISILVYIYPYIVPYQLTYQEAGTSAMTLVFGLIAAVIMIPVLLVYTGYAYYVFRGKVKEKLSY